MKDVNSLHSSITHQFDVTSKIYRCLCDYYARTFRNGPLLLNLIRFYSSTSAAGHTITCCCSHYIHTYYQGLRRGVALVNTSAASVAVGLLADSEVAAETSWGSDGVVTAAIRAHSRSDLGNSSIFFWTDDMLAIVPVRSMTRAAVRCDSSLTSANSVFRYPIIPRVMTIIPAKAYVRFILKMLRVSGI